MAWDPRYQMNTCPICEREHQVTPFDDVCIPACGCYDEPEDGAWPCESCGLNHAIKCPKREGYRAGDATKVIVTPLIARLAANSHSESGQ